jgi:hypothetical protein
MRSRASIERQAADLTAQLSDRFAAFVVDLGEFAAADGDVERARELLERTRRDVIRLANEYAEVIVLE